MIEPLVDPVRPARVRPMRFVIMGQEYGDTSGGVRALNRLCHWLNVLGHDASIGSVFKIHPEWEVKTWDGVMTPETIAIYADAFSGNPYHARRVVRWALYHPGLRAGAPTFGPGERAYYFAEIFGESTVAATADGVAKRLHVGLYEPHILYPWDGPKLYDAFWVGRGAEVIAKQGHLIDCARMLEFAPIYPTRAAFAKALRRTRNFYSFDPLSQMVPEAMLCGAAAHIVHLDGRIQPIGPYDPEAIEAFTEPRAFLEPDDVHSFLADMEAWPLT